jgi:hypothetical protein
MTVASATFPGTRVNDAEALGSVWTDLGGGKVTLDTDFVYQNSNSVSEKVSNTTGGIAYDDGGGTTNNLSTGGGSTVIFKIFIPTVGLLNVKGSTGILLEIGDGGSGGGGRPANQNVYHVHGSDTYPPDRSWLFIPIDPNETAHIDAVTGTVTLTAIDYYGIEITTTANVLGQSVAIDAIDFITNGTGINILNGTSPDPDATFLTGLDFDEGTAAERHGMMTTREGAIFCLGVVTIGSSATAVNFTDSNKQLYWEDGLFGAGFQGLEFNQENSATTIDINDIVFNSRGKAGIVRWFDTALDVDGTNNEIDITAHGFETGDYIQYSDEGGTAVSDLVDLDRYWVRAVSDDIISLHTTRAGAIGDTAQRVLTAASAPGENHKLTREPDTRAVQSVVGTAVTSDTALTDCIFDNWASLALNVDVVFTRVKILSSSRITLGTGTIDECTISTAILDEGDYQIDTATLADMTTCTLNTPTEGHAVRVSSNAGSPFTWDHVVTGQWAPAGIAGGAKGWEFDAGQAFTSEVITMDGVHDFTTGEAVFYNNEGGTDVSGLTNANKYYVNAISTTTLSLHITRSAAIADSSRINLTTGSTEQHALYSARATLFNDTGGAITVNVTGSGTAPSYRNATSASTTVVASVAISINGLTEGSRGSMTGDGGAEDGVELLAGYANSSGVISGGFSGATPQDVIIKARNGGIINAAILHDEGGSDTDFTDEARDNVGVDDVDLLPAVPATNDAFYFGGLAVFEEVEINVTTAGDTYILIWEYWDGGTWQTLTVTDDTNSFFTLGYNRVKFTAPSDWATTSFASIGPFFYIRARVTTGGGTQPQAEKMKLCKTIKYESFVASGNTIQPSSGLAAVVVWREDTNNP